VKALEMNSRKSIKIKKKESLNWKQIDAFDRNKTILFFPISPIEEHGPHLPTGTDFLPSRDAAIGAIRILMKKKPELFYILLPAVPLGFARIASVFPGTISVDVRTLKNIVYGVCSSLAKHRFKYLLICNSHMEIKHLKGIYLGMKLTKRKYNMKIYEPSAPYFFNKVFEKKDKNLGFNTPEESHAGFHGGFRETSLMKYLYPHLVDESHKELKSLHKFLFGLRCFRKTFKDLGFENGYVGSPSRADSIMGEKFFQEIVGLYVKSALDLHSGKELLDLPRQVKFGMGSIQILK
jgi:creatinine amidohydrolase